MRIGKDDPQTAKEFFTKCIQESQSGEIRDNWYTEEARIACLKYIGRARL